MDTAFKKLMELVGYEHELSTVCHALRHTVTRLDAPVVGALEVNCSDESELECIATFQRQFVDHLLPDLKTAARAPFRTCNLGARYEPGSLAVAENHFALPESRASFKVMLVKINGHVAVTDGAAGPEYGPMTRYETHSSACGALHKLLAGGHLPALDELRAAFHSGRHDRITTLLDERRVEQRYRYLLAAVASARLQAERAVQDARTHEQRSPTLHLVVPCVTMNRPGRDTELTCGFYVADRRTNATHEQYYGLGDDPAQYRVEHFAERVRVTEEHFGAS